MQFAVQACVQGRAMAMAMPALPSAVQGRHQCVGASPAGAPRVIAGLGRLVGGGCQFSSQFLAPGLGALRLAAQPRERGNGGRLRLGSGVRAGEAPRVGAYEKDAFANETEAQKIAHVRGSCGMWISCPSVSDE
jgi:hypothetical protein